MQIKFIRAFLLFWCLIISASAYAQNPSTDTLKLTLKQAEDQFLKNNLQLIAQHYNIGIAEAQVITAKLFPNPDFTFSTGLYDPATHKFFDHSAGQDEYASSFSQLFTTAGKRNKSIQLAKIGVEQAKYQFFDMLRTLKFTLHSDFYNIYFQEQSAKVYNEEIGSLAKTLTVFKEQYQKGNIAEKEVLRIQSQLYSLQTEYNSLVTGIDTVESELKLLIKAPVNAYVDPQVNFGENNKQLVASVPYQRLLDSAYVNRYDLRYSKATVD